VTSHQAEIKMQDQIDFPENFQHTSLKARSNTPILDLSCHNVQGINVWANTAPRGWGGNTPGPTGLPKGPAKQQAPPSFNLQPATPSIEQSLANKIGGTQGNEIRAGDANEAGGDDSS